MKPIVYTLFLLFTLSFSVVWAQEEDDDLPISDQLNAVRVAMITQKLELDSEQAAKFFPIYNEYSAKKEQLKKQLRKLRHDSKDLEETELEKNIKKSFDLKEEEIKLERTYFEKFKTVISVKQIAMLHHAERQFKRMLLKELAERGGRKDRGGRHFDGGR